MWEKSFSIYNCEPECVKVVKVAFYWLSKAGLTNRLLFLQSSDHSQNALSKMATDTHDIKSITSQQERYCRWLWFGLNVSRECVREMEQSCGEVGTSRSALSKLGAQRAFSLQGTESGETHELTGQRRATWATLPWGKYEKGLPAAKCLHWGSVCFAGFKHTWGV